MNHRQRVERAIRAASSKVKGRTMAGLGEVLGLKGPKPGAVVWAWCSRGSVPVEYCQAIKAIGAGESPLWDLRPDDWHLIWPELRTKKGAPPIATEAA